MTDDPFASPAVVATAIQAQIRNNAEAIADALNAIEVHLILLAKLDLAARGVALREATRACESGASESERQELCALQSEANAAFAQLRGIYRGLRDALVLFKRDIDAVDAKVPAPEQDRLD